jgi:hypothetical protein
LSEMKGCICEVRKERKEPKIARCGKVFVSGRVDTRDIERSEEY